jgi:hypothetical protein
MAKQTTCAHGNCDCQIDESRAVMKGGEAFCSDGCASGAGCSHPGCKCGGHAGTIHSD